MTSGGLPGRSRCATTRVRAASLPAFRRVPRRMYVCPARALAGAELTDETTRCGPATVRNGADVPGSGAVNSRSGCGGRALARSGTHIARTIIVTTAEHARSTYINLSPRSPVGLVYARRG